MRHFQPKQIVTVLCICLFAMACTRPNTVLDASKMAAVITDIHKADAILAVELSKGVDTKKDLDYYASVLDKHDISQSQFDSSLVWYTKNPKRFERVYIEVDKNMEQWQADLKAGKFGPPVEIRTNTLWERSTRFIAKDTATYRQSNFTVSNNQQLLYEDVYILSFIQKIEAKDINQTPQIKFKIDYTDGVKDSIVTKSYADSLTRRFTIQMVAKHPAKINSLSCELLVPESFDKITSVFDSVKLTRKYNFAIQDSLKRFVESPVKKP